MKACKSYTILGVDGNHLTIGETIERTAIVVSIQQNDEHGRIATVRLNREQFKELMTLDGYQGLDVNDEEEGVQLPDSASIPEAPAIPSALPTTPACAEDNF